MAMSVVYTTVNGQILHENRGGVVSHFISDPLGSVVMVRDNSGNTVYEAEYDPYGNVQSETGTNPSEFGYVGTLGYVKDSAFSLYVQARYLLTNLGRWLTKDPLWPSEPGFVYAGAMPSLQVDPSGESGLPIACAVACVAAAGCALGLWIACNRWQGAWGSFWECAKDYIDSLPIVSQAGCLAGLVGCVACLIKYSKPLPKPRPGPIKPNCAALARAYHVACPGYRISLNPHVTPCDPNDSCATVGYKATVWTACCAARVALALSGCPDPKPAVHAAALAEACGYATACATRWAICAGPRC